MLTASGSARCETQTPPFRITADTRQIEVQSDGEATNVLHTEIQVLTAAGVTEVGQLPIDFVASMHDLEIVEGYTQKSDGRKLSIDQSNIVTRQAPDRSSAPMFSDHMQKVIIFPNVEPGDLVVYTARRHDKTAMFPGHFTLASVFNPALARLVDITITVPKNFGLSIEAHDVEVHKYNAWPNNDLYVLHYANSTPAPQDHALISPIDRFPRVFASTFQNYDELANAYASMIDSKTVVTPTIRAQADDITAGITDRREQARAIYEWVSEHVRYVAISFGQGAIVPHNPDAILRNAFGDCKDHTVLFASLLKAKGIDSRPVLINLEKAYKVSSAPTIASFDHMIAWLPEFALYADTTAGVVPFGYLVPSEYGKPVVVIDKAQPSLRHTPVLAPGQGTTSYRNVVKIDKDMQLTSEGTTTATGAFAPELRLIGASIRARGQEASAAAILKRRGYAKGTGVLTAAAETGIPAEYVIQSKFTVPGPVNLKFMEPGLRPVPATGDYLMGPFMSTTVKDTDDTPCYSGRSVEDLTLEFPPTRFIEHVPADADVKTPNLHYTSRWSLDGNSLSVHREFVTNIDQPLCVGDVRKETAVALTKIAEDHQIPIALGISAGPAPLMVRFSPTDATVKSTIFETALSSPDAVGIAQSGLATSRNAPHIDYLRLSYEKGTNGIVFVHEEFAFHSPKGNATASRAGVISTPKQTQFSTADVAIHDSAEQQQRGAIHGRRYTCHASRSPYWVVERAAIIDADGERSNSVDFTIRCPASAQQAG